MSEFSLSFQTETLPVGIKEQGADEDAIFVEHVNGYFDDPIVEGEKWHGWHQKNDGLGIPKSNTFYVRAFGAKNELHPKIDSIKFRLGFAGLNKDLNRKVKSYWLLSCDVMGGVEHTLVCPEEEPIVDISNYYMNEYDREGRYIPQIVNVTPIYKDGEWGGHEVSYEDEVPYYFCMRTFGYKTGDEPWSFED